MVFRTLLRNKMGSKYLDDVIAQTGLDYDEAVEMIEREKKAMYVSSPGPVHCFVFTSLTALQRQHGQQLPPKPRRDHG